MFYVAHRLFAAHDRALAAIVAGCATPPNDPAERVAFAEWGPETTERVIRGIPLRRPQMCPSTSRR